MIGCFMLFAGTGFFVVLGIYMGSLMAYFSVLSAAMGIYFGGLIAYFTAFFMWLLG
jgi:hypothetical protein